MRYSVPTFPLLRLPSEASKNALQYCIVPELVLLSTLSNRAKRLVKSARRKASCIEINLHSGCKVVFGGECIICFGRIEQGESDIESLTPCTLRMRSEMKFFGDDTDLTLTGFGVREWCEHFMFTFNQPLVGVFFGFRNNRMYTLESVCKTLKGFSIGQLFVFENPCEVLRHFPVMSSLYMNKTGLEPELQGEDLNFIKKVLLGNITRVLIGRVIPMDLNTLLMMNSPNITSYHPSLADKELNTFLKLWLKGANQNLEQLSLRYSSNFNLGRTFNTSVILKGFKHELLIEEGRIFPRSTYHIRKNDGTMGIVFLDVNEFSLEVEPFQ
ncbi:hypothetical protein CAEBREN_02649 [Caenorhabditis brenneri]|uniref:F-box domain-containing protein n=1 Tax=Caenorhabditis brenneri TaxID=135651 RepID=G0N3G4_CAEBE|nr:hypothetical protein CAEBREN_02649 [Caenorhabditis brenneri]